MIKKISHFIKTRPYISGTIALAVIIIFLFSRAGTSNAKDILVVHPQDFVQKLTVSGTVVAAQNADLGFAQGGRIVSVHAAVGDSVQAGTILAEVENGDARATLLQKQAALQTAQAKLHAAQNGTRPEQVAVSESQLAGDQAALGVADQAAINALKNAYSSIDTALASYIDQFFGGARTNPSFGFNISNGSTTYHIEGGSLTFAINAKRSQINDLMASLNTLNQTLSTEKDILNVNTVALQTLQATQSLISNISTVVTGYSSSDTASQTIYNGFKTALASAGLNINTAISSLTSAMSAEKAAVSAVDKDQKNLDLAKAGSIQTDIDIAVANVAAANADVLNALAQLNKTIVKAPFDGMITKMNAKVGEIASSNASDISINSNGTYQVQSNVPEVYVSSLHVGDTASSTLDAYGPAVFFPLKVIAIDPAQTVVNGVSNYKTTLQFLAEDARIRIGMTANITIKTGEVQNALVVPQGAVFSKNDQQFVQIINGKNTIDQQVAVGVASSLGQVQIVTGLHDGDRVVLNPIVK
jgi:RND family efflux transporter MFP subunit